MALEVFQEMKIKKCKPNICTYTALVNACARDGMCEKAEEIFEQLQEVGLEPDVYAYNALIESLQVKFYIICILPKEADVDSCAGFPYGAAEIFSLMQQMGCDPDRASYNIMLDAYGRAGLHKGAQEVFDEMHRLGIEPTLKSHMLLISAYLRIGDTLKCEEIVRRMQESGIKPGTFILNAMMYLYGRLGKFKKMKEVLATMESSGGGCRPDISTYNILINVYGQLGFMKRMEEVVKTDVMTWTSRLGAYSRKKHYKRCVEIFEEMIDSGCYPDGGTAKVLLSSCSSEEQIEQVTTVIGTMHRQTLKV